jgi:hypothetical protein
MLSSDSMSGRSALRRRSYAVHDHSVRLSFYLKDRRLSEFDAIVDEVVAELAKVGLTLSEDTTFLNTNKAGMFLSSWFSYQNDKAGLQLLVERLERQKWPSVAAIRRPKGE